MLRKHDVDTRSTYRRMSLEQRIALFGAVLPNMQVFLEQKTNEALRRILAPPITERAARIQMASGYTPDATKPHPATERRRILDSAQVPYAIGGALSFGFWAVPRTTFDVDFNYFTVPDDAGQMLKAIEEHAPITDEYGVVLKSTAIPCDGPIIRFWWKGTKIEAFGPTIPVFSQQALERARRVNVLGTSLSVLSAEAIAVFKLIFGRPQDWVDLQALIDLNPDLDKQYIRDTILMIFDDNPELPAIVCRWDEIAQHGPVEDVAP
ncbi:hypothetical protein HDU87_007648 [Geranomyces variabilis]|uniref:Nucleotidyl transferase AbiEii/AbiGii toxin family protein n=1 Tax=Geranomyces variabilis TaxID=109894 RepID=A0AAD5TJB5_9FUNG|nr:hypothetical protein HDU87_007648 [Geranomyces variabilis]